MTSLAEAHKAASKLYRVRWKSDGYFVMYNSPDVGVWMAVDLPMPKLEAQRVRARLVALSGLYMLGANGSSAKITKAIYRNAPASAYNILRGAAAELGLFKPRKGKK